MWQFLSYVFYKFDFVFCCLFQVECEEIKVEFQVVVEDWVNDVELCQGFILCSYLFVGICDDVDFMFWCIVFDVNDFQVVQVWFNCICMMGYLYQFVIYFVM